MAVRTTVVAVKQIIETSLADAIIDAYIATASDLVDEIAAGADLGSTRLTDIEKWMTAHLIAMTRERQTTQELLGEASVKYAGEFGQGLKATTYGQMVLTLDTSGIFASKGKTKINITAITSFD